MLAGVASVLGQVPAPQGTPALQQPPGPRSFWHWLRDVGSEPGVVEFGLALLVLGAVFLFWLRLARLVRDARSRHALGDYLLGVEQALHGDLEGAHERLAAVVANDPENHYARLLLGKVLAERGDPEAAHQQHVCLKTAFGVDSPQNDLMLARSLLAAGMPREAAEAAERALGRAPEHAAGLDFVFRARLQCGDFEAAARAGKQLVGRVRDGQQRQRLQGDVARALAQAGAARLQRGDAAGARAMLQDARAFDVTSDSAALLAARLDADRAGVPATVQTLLGDGSGRDGGNVGVGGGGAGGALVPAPAAAAGSARGLPVTTIGGLTAPSRYACRACELPLPDRVGECPRCQRRDPAVLVEARLVAELPSPTHAMDAVDANEAHVQRLVQRALEGNSVERPAARAELLELRELAVPALLRAAWNANERIQDPAIEILRAMGPTIAPALFTASDGLTQERVLPFGSRSPAALVGRVVQGFDRSALPHVEPLFASAKAEHRKILIDFFLGLHDVEQFQLVLERFPPVEILHRLNRADGDVLRRFLQAVPRGHFVATSLLIESTFHRDAELLAAVPGAADPDVLLQVMRARGPSRSALAVLVEALADEALADVAERVLGELGEGALDHVLAAFADPECSTPVRARLRRVLLRQGPPAATAVCDGFGPEPTPLDDELRAVLAGLGDAAVPALQSAYSHSGWLEKVSLGLISRHTNRRVQIVLALRAIGTAAAASALRELAAAETDANLKLRFDQALHGLGGAGGGAAGGGAGGARG